MKRELEKDNWMMLCFGVAKELGMGLGTLFNTMTQEEIVGWSCYFGILNDEQAKAMGR
jgi:hypothetical protein